MKEQMKLYLALILLLPLCGGLINALLGRYLPRRVGETIACGVIWGAFTCSVLAFLNFTAPVKIEYASWLSDFDFKAPIALYLDQLSLSLALMITFVCGLIHLYSLGYMKDDPSYARYFALLNIFVFAMLTLILAENLPLLYLGWEGVGFCSYALIGFWYKEEKNATAGRKAFIVTRIGDTAFGIAMIWMFQLFGTESITELNGMGFLMPAGIVTALGILLLIGAAGKSAQLPPRSGLMLRPAPHSISPDSCRHYGYSGVYLLARMCPLIGSATTQAAIAITGGLTAFYAASCACTQRDLKRILAYSTISQIGYMILGVGAGALTAASFHLLTHAFFKALLFLGAGCVITALHHQQDIYCMGGLKSRLPAVYWPFLAGSLCLAGFPGSGGFFSKDAILAAVFERGGPLYGSLFALGLLTALMTAFYTFRMLFVVFHGPTDSRQQSSDAGFSPLPAIMTVTLVPLAILGLFGGIINLPEYLGSHGLLSGYLKAIPGFAAAAHTSSATEIILQIIAAAACLLGLGFARAHGARRALTLASEQTYRLSPVPALGGIWTIQLLFIRPFVRLARFFWKMLTKSPLTAFWTGWQASYNWETAAAWNTGRGCIAVRLGRRGGGGAGVCSLDCNAMTELPLLSILIFLPLFGCLLLLPAWNRPVLLKAIALGTATLELLLTLWLYVFWEKLSAAPQKIPGYLLLQDSSWIPEFGIRYYLGLDGISLLLVLLTSFTFCTALLVSWNSIKEKCGLFLTLMLVMEAGITGVFLALDLALFYLFWEVMLIPMFFLIGIWGHGRKIYSTIKFFLFTMFGSLLMLLAIIALHLLHYRQTGTATFGLHELLKTQLPADTQLWLFVAFFLAFAIKFPLFPLHTWLPDAHTDARPAASCWPDCCSRPAATV
jgi:NADH-quinone oxidoreductase subunit L